MAYQKNLDNLAGKTINRAHRPKRTHRVARKVGTDVLRLVPGGRMDQLTQVFEEQIQTHGTLLVGPRNMVGFLSFVQQHRVKELLQAR